uniref:Uncharacterized protein n=1 Tax=Aegilops tauschii subsp. strangulata TaxID=200361 RepID=A0A452Y4M5_AEGTS
SQRNTDLTSTSAVSSRLTARPVNSRQNPAEAHERSSRPSKSMAMAPSARQLRARMSEMESFHDAMYHSAIASRLARST